MSNRKSSVNIRPRATKHLYRPASADHVVRHLGTPISRQRPLFVFAGREFFQRTTNYSPLHQRALPASVSHVADRTTGEVTRRSFHPARSQEIRTFGCRKPIADYTFVLKPTRFAFTIPIDSSHPHGSFLALSRPSTSRFVHRSSTPQFADHSVTSDAPDRTSCGFNHSSSMTMSQLNERDRRSTLQLQRQLNLPRQGWINQHS